MMSWTLSPPLFYDILNEIIPKENETRHLPFFCGTATRPACCWDEESFFSWLQVHIIDSCNEKFNLAGDQCNHEP